VETARQAAIPVLYTVLAYRSDYADASRPFREIQQPVMTVGGLIRGTADTAIVDEVAPVAGEVVIDKQHSDAFRGTNLDAILRAQDVDDLVVCGVTTAVCVAGSARSASELGYQTWIVNDATAETSTALHSATLEVFVRAFGYVTDTATTCSAWAGELTVAGDRS
jgi:nicotinamidase-related amidase